MGASIRRALIFWWLGQDERLRNPLLQMPGGLSSSFPWSREKWKKKANPKTKKQNGKGRKSGERRVATVT